MHDDQHIANALQCNSTSNRSTIELVRKVSVKVFYLALLIGAVYVSTKPNTNGNTLRFISACQNLAKKRPVEHPVRESSSESGCSKQDMPPTQLAIAA
jgi:hypothetical protein